MTEKKRKKKEKWGPFGVWREQSAASGQLMEFFPLEVRHSRSEKKSAQKKKERDFL